MWMNQFLKRDNLPTLRHEETDGLNRPVSIKEVEAIIHNFHNGSMRPTWVYWWILLNMSGRTCTKCPQPLSESRSRVNTSHSPLIDCHYAKPDKDIIRKLQTNLSHEHRSKISQQIAANQIQRCTERTIHLHQLWLITGMQYGLNIQKGTRVIYHIDRWKEREHTILSIEAEEHLPESSAPSW